MKALQKKMMTLAVAGVVAAVAGFGATSMTLGGGTTGSTTTKPGAQDEKHPEIRRALVGLREAKRSLEHADHDFDGHRAAALKSTDEAIKECEEALKVDKK